jgi:phasin family protein
MLRRSKAACNCLMPPYTWFHVALQQKTCGAMQPGFQTQKPQEKSPMLTAEQVIAAQKANLETLFDLTTKAFEGVEKLVELNLQVAKATLGEVQSTATASLSVKDAQELLALQAGLLQPAAEKAAAYGRHLYDIAASTNAEVTKVAEAQVAAAQAKFTSAVDGAVKNAPAGTESAAALVKSAIAAASNAMETMQKATKQATEVAEANFQSLTNSAVKATQATAKAAKKTAA